MGSSSGGGRSGVKEGIDEAHSDKLTNHTPPLSQASALHQLLPELTLSTCGGMEFLFCVDMFVLPSVGLISKHCCWVI